MLKKLSSTVIKLKNDDDPDVAEAAKAVCILICFVSYFFQASDRMNTVEVLSCSCGFLKNM